MPVVTAILSDVQIRPQHASTLFQRTYTVIHSRTYNSEVPKSIFLVTSES